MYGQKCRQRVAPIKTISAGATHCCGFTLLELLVALAIFAVLSAMAYGGLNSVMRSRQGVEVKAQRLADVQTALTIMERDLEQTLPRAVRDQYGDPTKIFQVSSYGDYKLEFTRAGWNNPFPSEKRIRSLMQRVAYGVKENQLLRTYWFDLDRGYESPSFETVLLDKVKAMDLRFVDQELEWQNDWPVLGSKQVLPNAVEVTLDVEGLGHITRLFRLPAQPEIQQSNSSK
jgi:general secretion pathway protein J